MQKMLNDAEKKQRLVLKQLHSLVPVNYDCSDLYHCNNNKPLQGMAPTECPLNACMLDCLLACLLPEFHRMFAVCVQRINKPLQGMAPTECPLNACLHACLFS